jgi:hypothetical protein
VLSDSVASVSSRLLPSIFGMNLCVDIFGAHSPGEVQAGRAFHGEASQVMWQVTAVTQDDGAATMTLVAYLRHTQVHGWVGGRVDG